MKLRLWAFNGLHCHLTACWIFSWPETFNRQKSFESSKKWCDLGPLYSVFCIFVVTLIQCLNFKGIIDQKNENFESGINLFMLLFAIIYICIIYLNLTYYSACHYSSLHCHMNPSENILIYWFDSRKTFLIIINVSNLCCLIFLCILGLFS